MNLFKTMVACDVSEVAIKLAREQASKEGVANISFAIEDIGRIRLPAEAYDVVLMNMALHHVRNLE